MCKVSVLLYGGLIALGLMGAHPAFAQKKSVAEEILDILRANDQISEQQYRDLLNKARAEEEVVQAAVEKTKPNPSGFRVFWKEGLNMESGDADFKLKIGGRIQNDWAIFDTDREIRETFGQIGDGTRFRRARLFLEGEIYKNIKYKAEYEFAGGDATFTDVYLELKDLPLLGSYQVGHFKEPFSLEELTSSRFLSFMERSLNNSFAPARNTGMMVSNGVLDKRATWALGVFRETDSFGDGFGTDSAYNLTTRVTGLPWYMDKGRQLLHLGLSYSHKFRDGQKVRFRARPETSLGPRFVDTQDFAVAGIDLLNPELALVYGPFSLQGEWTRAMMDATAMGDPDFDAWYVYGTYFLTGENRPYKTSSGTFDRVIPHRNFDGKGGLGAWEVGVRYAQIDLNDRLVKGGRLEDITFGVNWYVNPNVRFHLNYVFGDVAHGGEANIVQARFQVDF